MKRRTIILILVVALFACILSACGDSITLSYSEKSDKIVREYSGFEVVEGKDYLSYATDTHVVYYMFTAGGINGYSYTYFSPYISENGNFCKYVDGQIVEISNQTPA